MKKKVITLIFILAQSFSGCLIFDSLKFFIYSNPLILCPLATTNCGGLQLQNLNPPNGQYVYVNTVKSTVPQSIPG